MYFVFHYLASAFHYLLKILLEHNRIKIKIKMCNSEINFLVILSQYLTFSCLHFPTINSH